MSDRQLLLLGRDAFGPSATTAEGLDTPGATVLAASRVHPIRGAPNQDGAAVYTPPAGGVILAVVDGMGGMPNGDLAAAATLRSLGKCLVKTEGDDLTRAILDGIDQANRAVRDLPGSAGATLAVVELHAGTARTYHVGDAGVLIVGQRGALKHKTAAHSPVGYAVEAGLLDSDDAMHHADRHLVSNAVGTQDMRIEVGPPVRLAARDTILVASDGIFDNLTEAEVIEIIRKGALDRAARTLAETAAARMDGTAAGAAGAPSKADDATFLMARRSRSG